MKSKSLSRINSATLISWTKGFCSSGVVGEDVVKLLEQALARRGDINCEIVAVVNDTVGTLMSCAFDDHSCQIGLIAGTGSNACYMEKQSNITKLDEIIPEGKMIINMEWGAFGDDGCLDNFVTGELQSEMVFICCFQFFSGQLFHDKFFNFVSEFP